ncbi:MAG: polysaccharide deacetylase family protein [Prevotella sp.]|nr:polysaccharide deacetylase family protein [Bacteroides sp.]MCM1365709.1 polysaccharide deacetylase family protein [Prevotella sp.]MCM1436379.1 polysaccharide deacetylase family protein [Prevotella sp.]
MLIERPPRIFRALFPGSLFRFKSKGKQVMLTFDDGPIPESTPELLRILREHDVKASFFMVGDNVRKYPELYEMIGSEGHSIGNHTMHHIQGIHCGTGEYMTDVSEAKRWIETRFFRPPHGILRSGQLSALRQGYKIVMYDLVTRDYSRRVDAKQIVENVKRYTRPGSIIVFHDSLRAIDKLRTALPESLRWLKESGYEPVTLEEITGSVE